MAILLQASQEGAEGESERTARRVI
jgi:hypothetical protein